MALSTRRPLNGQGVLRIPVVMNSKRNDESKFGIGTITKFTMRGKDEEVVEIMKNKNSIYLRPGLKITERRSSMTNTN